MSNKLSMAAAVPIPDSCNAVPAGPATAETLKSSERKIEGQYFITNSHSILISILTLAILFFIFKPSLVLNSTQLLSLTLYHC